MVLDLLVSFFLVASGERVERAGFANYGVEVVALYSSVPCTSKLEMGRSIGCIGCTYSSKNFLRDGLGQSSVSFEKALENQELDVLRL